jgi:hypothetical protein
MAKTSDVYVIDANTNAVRVEKNVAKPDLAKLQKLVGGFVGSLCVTTSFQQNVVLTCGSMRKVCF